jgi:hypothetical protein
MNDGSFHKHTLDANCGTGLINLAHSGRSWTGDKAFNREGREEKLTMKKISTELYGFFAFFAAFPGDLRG